MHSNRGQVGIILLLITVVMLTVGISVVSRSTSDVSISNSNEQANRALDAAESDIEKALSQDLSTYTPGTSTINGNTVNTEIVRQRTLEAHVEQGYTVGVDLTGVSAAVSIQWARETGCQAASLVLSVFNTNAANPPVRRYFIGPPTSSCNRSDNFTAASAGSNGYTWRTSVTPLTGDYLMRIRPLYNATDVSVTGTNMPTQAYVVRSTAQNEVSQETKAIEVNKTLPVAPAVFDYVLFSGTSITQ